MTNIVVRIICQTYLSFVYLGYKLTITGAYSAVILCAVFLVATVKVYLLDELSLSTNDWIVAAIIVFSTIPGLCLILYGLSLIHI